MKGFIKILEAIIASILILSSLTFFFSFQRPFASQQLQFNYVLAALEKNNSLKDYIKSNDVTAINTTLRNILPLTADFSLEIQGIPNPVIKIACVCTDAQESELISRLSPLVFTYRSRTIEMRIDNGNPADPNNLDNLAKSRADILFFFGYQDLSVKKDLLRKFLQNGTLFMLADLQQTQVEDSVMNSNEFFGLSWGTTDAATGKFIDTDNPENVSYRISRYYRSLGGGKNELFTPREMPLPTVPSKNRIFADSRTIVGSPFPPSLPTTSFVKINEVGNRGRTVLFVDYDKTFPSDGDNTNMRMLLKAAAMWASGERYRMDPQFKIIPSTQPYRQYSYVGVLDDFETFFASLKIWNVFF